MTIAIIADIMIVVWGALMLLSMIGLIIIHFCFKVPMHENEMEDKLDEIIKLMKCYASDSFERKNRLEGNNMSEDNTDEV